jgi:hypothetical protein
MRVCSVEVLLLPTPPHPQAHKHIAKAEQEHLEIMARKAAQEKARAKAALEKQEAVVAQRAAAIIEREERDRRAREARERGEQLLQQWKMERKGERGGGEGALSGGWVAVACVCVWLHAEQLRRCCRLLLCTAAAYT